ncbi:unnamed protein product [Parascedosporium putredinis]|uniref:Uncharacterized protein n=1 Tax=Parascedosporium putredinis TaxID=1442378 RepID=A0A9P1H9X3_9PEZI|nr:unnamed protein product [Parascedosporium putredinis]CAI8001430.1 unnamed protein product [Parascedosporium putredinis]
MLIFPPCPKLSVWLFNFVNSVKGVDTKVVNLSEEVTRLSNLLSSVEKTVRKCSSQSLILGHLDDHMWQQIENALVDCKVTVDGLDQVVMRLMNTYDAEASKLTTLAVVNVSLTFRTTSNQDTLFQELQNLKLLIVKTLQVAHLVPEPANASTEGGEQQEQKPADPFSLRQSRNLERLAKAATKFHRETSTAASQKSSLWGGSEFGTDLSDEQRARIQTWNELASIPESFAGDTTTDTGSTYGASTLNPETDASTNVTVPDREDAVSSPSQSESDFELDFLRNLEELAYKNFASANYSKAEECLRRSVDRSTDDSSPRLTSLKTQLVLCYCVQEKWDAAFAILEILPKTKTIECLPIYELLQAVALGYQHTSRLEEASKTLKIALQAKRRILGRQSNGYYMALAHLARIFEDMGDSLEAEVVRHSIPAHITVPVSESSSSTTTLVKSLIDNHELIGKIFVKTDAEASDTPQPPPAQQRSRLRNRLAALYLPQQS